MKDYSKLILEAKKAREKSYSPYSKYKVGAALLAKNGKIYAGTNIENAIYRGTHAEKFALDTAVFNSEREFEAIAIVSADEDPARPCGQCLQDLTEFDIDGRGSLIVIVANLKGKIITFTLAELLPQRFGPKNLGIDVKKY